MDKKLILGIVAVVLVAFGGWYYMSNNSTTNADVVAKVNGQEITKQNLEDTKKRLTSGQDLSGLDEATMSQLETQALETLISAELIKQAAREAQISVTDEQVSTELTSIKGQFQDDATYQQALVLQGITEQKLTEDLANDLLINAYITQKVDFSSITVTDEEIQSLYDQEKEINPEVAPLDSLSDQIRAFVTQQKQQEIIAAHVAELRAAAEVEILI